MLHTMRECRSYSRSNHFASKIERPFESGPAWSAYMLATVPFLLKCDTSAFSMSNNENEFRGYVHSHRKSAWVFDEKTRVPTPISVVREFSGSKCYFARFVHEIPRLWYLLLYSTCVFTSTGMQKVAGYYLRKFVKWSAARIDKMEFRSTLLYTHRPPTS